MNKVVLIGRITKDPEIRYTAQSGVPSVRFTLAVDRGVKDNTGARMADFISCVAWRNSAEFISRYIKKGYLLCVEGRIQTGSFQGQDNQTHYTTDVVVDNIENLTPRDPNAVPTAQPQQGYQQAPQGQYQGYNNPAYGAPRAQQSYQQPQQAPNSFTVDVADDDLPF